jgi:transposase
MITELRVSGEILRGISANIELHSSNLQIHLHTIKNTTGLVADVNRQRSAVYAMVGKINHILNVIGQKDSKLSGLDVEMRMGDISLQSAYRAYEGAQKHLVAEILRFGEAIDAQWRRIDAVAEMSKGVPQRSKILHWLNCEVKPSLTKANDSAAAIYEEIQLIKPLEKQVIAEMKGFD